MRGHFTDTQLKTAVSKFFPSCDIEPVERGVSSFTYKLSVKRDIFYLTVSKDKQESLQSRYNGLKLLQQAGAKVTRPFAFQDFCEELDGHSFLVTYEVPGGSIEDYQSDDLQHILVEAGRSLALAHDIKLESFGYTTHLDKGGRPRGTLDSYYEHIAERVRYRDSFQNKLQVLEEYEVLTPDLVVKVGDYVAKNRHLLDLDCGVMIHGDFSAEHIFASDKTFTGIIDWDGMASGSRFYDLAQFSTYYDQKLLTYLLQGYSEISGRQDGFDSRLLLERLIYCIGKVAKAYKFNRFDEEGYYTIAREKLLEDVEKI